MIVIPDIHGRDFWKNVVKERKPREVIVFLGDYLDPYPQEWKDASDPELEWPEHKDAFDLWGHTWNNFNEIIEYKKKNPKTTILLLGNHDMHYVYNTGNGSRYDHFHARQIENKFLENKELFQLAYEKKIGKKRFIFSHAGIHKLWIKDWFGDVVTNKNVVDYLNNLYAIDSPDLQRALDQCSAYRGGWESCGSVLWSDIMEWAKAEKSDYGDVQVFGHTQLKGEPVNLKDTFYDLDVRRGFRIDKDGNVCELNGKIIPKSK